MPGLEGALVGGRQVAAGVEEPELVLQRDKLGKGGSVFAQTCPLDRLTLVDRESS